jgi:hypothetical protein
VRLVRTPIVGAVARWASRLRFPVLFALTALLAVVDLAWPDPLPFLDELVLALGAVLLASLRRRDRDDEREDGPARRPEEIR